LQVGRLLELRSRGGAELLSNLVQDRADERGERVAPAEERLGEVLDVARVRNQVQPARPEREALVHVGTFGRDRVLDTERAVPVVVVVAAVLELVVFGPLEEI